ncbi:MAG: hypothetical protein IPJ81_05185 [Chitinophagaceae bacterium]|nr:hypothetical protein [Chitinophagaceae bacterium]
MSYKNAEAPKPFPVVAIGASAGGLEAITELLKYLLPDLGMCYVVIQHLSPTHESILPELIDRQTTMKVYKVTDGIEVFANCIYVIPPNTFMSIVDGHLRIFPRIKIDGVMHPIDFFLPRLLKYTSKMQ